MKVLAFCSKHVKTSPKRHTLNSCGLQGSVNRPSSKDLWCAELLDSNDPHRHPHGRTRRQPRPPSAPGRPSPGSRRRAPRGLRSDRGRPPATPLPRPLHPPAARPGPAAPRVPSEAAASSSGRSATLIAAAPRESPLAGRG